jgi:hypothetical protein
MKFYFFHQFVFTTIQRSQRRGWILGNCTGTRGLFPEQIAALPSDSLKSSCIVFQTYAIGGGDVDPLHIVEFNCSVSNLICTSPSSRKSGRESINRSNCRPGWNVQIRSNCHMVENAGYPCAHILTAIHGEHLPKAQAVMDE